MHALSKALPNSLFNSTVGTACRATKIGLLMNDCNKVKPNIFVNEVRHGEQDFFWDIDVGISVLIHICVPFLVSCLRLTHRKLQLAVPSA